MFSLKSTIKERTMIVHIFTAERYHLVPSIARGFITTYRSDAQHRVVLSGSTKTHKELYDRLFREADFTDYYFAFTRKQLFDFLRQNKNHSILFSCRELHPFYFGLYGWLPSHQLGVLGKWCFVKEGFKITAGETSEKMDL